MYFVFFKYESNDTLARDNSRTNLEYKARTR